MVHDESRVSFLHPIHEADCSLLAWASNVSFAFTVKRQAAASCKLRETWEQIADDPQTRQVTLQDTFFWAGDWKNHSAVCFHNHRPVISMGVLIHRQP